jgi:membrane protease YdiL (CAAX protease family)
VEGARIAGGALNRTPVREALAVWAAVIGGLAVLEVIAWSVSALKGVVGAVAVAAFLYVPLRFLERRGQDAHDAGWRFDRLRADVAWSLGVCAVVLPVFGLLFVQFTRWLVHLPAHTREWLAPYLWVRGTFHLEVPMSWDFAGQVAGNAAVAFSEEFFYRGYMTLRFEERWTPLRSAVAAAALFAIGHLLTPAPWRLAVFFPALLFAWVRNRTGTIVGASIAHFLCNVWLLVLERSAFG